MMAFIAWDRKHLAFCPEFAKVPSIRRKIIVYVNLGSWLVATAYVASELRKFGLRKFRRGELDFAPLPSFSKRSV